MKKTEALAKTKTIYPQLEPTQMNGIVLDGEAVIITGKQVPVALIIYGDDLERVRSFIDNAIKQRNDG